MPSNVTTAARLEPEATGGVRPASLVTVFSTVGSGDDIKHVLTNCPADTSAGFLAFPDVRRGFTRMLCERLQQECVLDIAELDQGRPLYAGGVLVVPAQCGVDLHDGGEGGTIWCEPVDLDSRPSEMTSRVKDSCKQAGAAFGSHVVAVMLSGLAGDCLQAISEIKSLGGQVVTIDDSSALVNDGPRAVVQAGLADQVLPLWAVGAHIGEALGTR